MRITDLFERSISRPINGVVKADQLDDSSVWQELDEFFSWLYQAESFHQRAVLTPASWKLWWGPRT